MKTFCKTFCIANVYKVTHFEVRNDYVGRRTVFVDRRATAVTVVHVNVLLHVVETFQN